MKKQIMIGLVAALFATPALAALKVGDTAPDFSATAVQAGKEFSFNLKKALKKGPAVVYFYPAAYTKGCDIEAHAFAENADKFAAVNTTIIGVSADSPQRLQEFSSDPSYCAGKFPVASDAHTTIAESYKLSVTAARKITDERKGTTFHAIIERVTFVVGKNGKILATLSSKDDSLSPDQHVSKSLEIVSAK
jgi:peroxiredoxin